MAVTYQINTAISPEQFIELLNKCSLGARRPIDNYYVIKGMLDNADLLITAWVGEQEDKEANKEIRSGAHDDSRIKELIGVARCVSDFSYCCYLSDLAVAENYQHQGIGKLMIKKIEQQLPPSCKIILLSAPQASDAVNKISYPKIGFTKHENAWVKMVN
ncbi:GNAT family N-acetyltransferase [Psychrobacter sp. LV10R520-6]|uniref:GNAT family N-acetyltransferase n=1 Tax=Psychrobacter sp. LV10R520-6 TaxID=1415574 RepID=UPI0024C63446|nr:GNAT family N-acetyltransferase [Psychrobacter sp. LV10R520-6]SNT69181.1 Ribosomal protein S18 acetylase RimI [Psychrobacter sp. LV10R520-6]